MDINGDIKMICKTSKKSISYIIYRDSGKRITEDELFI